MSSYYSQHRNVYRHRPAGQPLRAGICGAGRRRRPSPARRWPVAATLPRGAIASAVGARYLWSSLPPQPCAPNNPIWVLGRASTRSG